MLRWIIQHAEDALAYLALALAFIVAVGLGHALVAAGITLAAALLTAWFLVEPDEWEAVDG